MNKHHEDTDAHENKFRKDVKNFKECVAELGNPFSEDDNSLVQIMSRTVMNNSSLESVKKCKENWRRSVRGICPGEACKM